MKWAGPALEASPGPGDHFRVENVIMYHFGPRVKGFESGSFALRKLDRAGVARQQNRALVSTSIPDLGSSRKPVQQVER